MIEMSASIVNLTKALHDFQKRVSKVFKDSNNPHFRSTYASLTGVLQEVSEPLNACGLVLSQFPSGLSDGVNLTTMLIHAESGEYFKSEFSMALEKKKPQDVGSCITYMRRYAILSILKLGTEDDDSNSCSGVSSADNRNDKRDKEIINESEDNDMLKFKNFIKMIDECDNLESLKKIGTDIAVSDLSDQRKVTLKKRYSDVSKKLKGE